MSPVQSIIHEILSKRHDLSEDQVLALIEEKKKEGRGLLSDEGAARLVAEELLIQTHGTELGRMQVKHLVSGLNDVTISGRILLAWPPREFRRRDGTSGRIMRLVLADKSGRASCAIWDRHVDILSGVGNLQGRVVRIGHAYTRQGMAGDVEIHAGDRSSIEVDPHDLPTSDFPELKELFTPLAKLVAPSSGMNAVGIIQTEPRYYSFSKEGRIGSVLRTLLEDDSGSIPIVAWNERAEQLRALQKGSVLQIINARTRLDTNAKPELHIEARSQVEILSAPPEYLKMPVPRIHKIADVTSRTDLVDLTVAVLIKGEPQELRRATGETLKVSRLIVADETGVLPLSLWDDKAELANQIREGELIELHGVSARERMGDISLSLGRSGKLQTSTAQPSFHTPVTKLSGLNTAKGLVIVEGVVGDEPLARQIVTNKGETVNLASFTVRDETGSAKVTLWRDQAAGAAKLRGGTKVRITGVRVRPGLNGQLELSSIQVTKIDTIEHPTTERPAWEDIRHVIALEDGLTTWIKGTVLDVADDQRLVALCETCKSELNVSQKNFFCDKCNSSKHGTIALVGRLTIDDGTGVADVILSDHDLEQFVLVNPQQVREEMLKDGRSTLDRRALSNLVGKEIEAYGTAQQVSQGKFDFKARKILTLGKL